MAFFRFLVWRSLFSITAIPRLACLSHFDQLMAILLYILFLPIWQVTLALQPSKAE
jgi:hypothetical protein